MSLDGQTNITPESRLWDEIRSLLIHSSSPTAITVYLPNEGPLNYSYTKDGFLKKGVFKGEYTKRNLKNLVNIVNRGEYSFAKVSSKSLYSYSFWLEV